MAKKELTLECSSRGDKRFSAFYAMTRIGNAYLSIENHYQLAKRFNDGIIPTTWKDAKGKAPTHFICMDKRCPVEYLGMYYKMLWYKYLSENPQLVLYVGQFTKFTDMFKGKSTNCQAEVIAAYVKDKDALFNECYPFLEFLKTKLPDYYGRILPKES